MSIDQLIDKATSPDLQDDDYGTLLDLVELVNQNPSANVITALRLLKVKLQSSNANTLLRSITLLDFLAENCGAMMKATIATPDFIDNYLLTIIDDSIIHISVKLAMVNEIYKLSKSFQNDSSLSIMTSTFNNLKSRYPDLTNQAINQSSNTSNQPPNNDEDMLIKKAIEESLRETTRTKNMVPPQQPPRQSQDRPLQPVPVAAQSSPSMNNQPQLQPQYTQQSQQQQPQQYQPPQPPQLEEDMDKPEKVVALYDLVSDDEDTLSFQKNDIITIVEEINADWLRGCLNGKAGIIPTNYVKRIPKTTNADLSNLMNLLNNSFDVETTLSQLMDLKKKLSTNSINNTQFQSILLSNNFPSKLQQIEKQKALLKQCLDLQHLKILELNSLQSNIENSLTTYQSLISQGAGSSNNIESQSDTSISQFIQTYPDISNLNIK